MTTHLTLKEARRLGLIPKEQPEAPATSRKRAEGVQHPKLSGEAVAGVVGGVRHMWRFCVAWHAWMTLCEVMTMNEPKDGVGDDCIKCLEVANGL